jgi:segregation and condensation protein B
LREPRRRRGRGELNEAELDEAELVADLRRRAWTWLACASASPEVPVTMSLPANDAAPVTMGGDLPAQPAPGPRKRVKLVAEPPDGVASLRRNAWWRLRPPMPMPASDVPKRRRGKRDASVSDATADLRRRAWAWFAPSMSGEKTAADEGVLPGGEVVRAHLKGVLEALIFASEHPFQAKELARAAQADLKLVRALLAELVGEYHARGVRLDEVAGGFVFRTNPVFAPFVREQVAKKPVKMSRAQIETLAIVAYRQPITRPEIDEVRGVDSGAVLKSLLERDLVRILGKKDEPGRPMLYGTTPAFLEFFGLKALGDLPTLREFTELTDESKRTYERELGEDPTPGVPGGLMGGEGEMRGQSDKDEAR